ncbi:histidine kinase [Hymenobacter sp. M29]|uniref:Histidine kinase n=1 Tax=Hymenobacter mellowenesis TaxID=3063995 RepID=A0ABT9AA96_9BACT|nr:histidine kinase [Hymenobacter sp. M29]MDO7845916.1 histidine kinase [Hymenobacter sp. M29]
MSALAIRALLLVLGLLAGGAGCAATAPPADSTRWIDADDTPWLREIRRLPAAHERPLAYWQAQAPAHPRPTLPNAVLLDRLAEATAVRDVAAAYPLHQAALRLARQLPYPQVRAEMLLALADYHTQLAHYDSAAFYLPAAEKQFRLDHNLGGVVRCLGRLGRIAEQQGRYAASVAYHQRVLDLATTGNTRRFHTDAQIDLGTLHARVNDYATARHYLLEARQVAAVKDYPDRMNRALGELGEIYRQQHQWAAARQYLTRSVAISRQIKETPYALAKQLSLALLREGQGQYPAAAAEGRQVLAELQTAQLPLQVPLAQALLARLALRAGQVGPAIAYGRQSLAGSRQARLLAGVAEASAVLAEAYDRQRAYGPALAALRQYNTAHDSLTGDNTHRRAALLQYGQERQQQVAQIRLLTQQTLVQDQRRELEQVRAQRTLMGLGGLALLAGGLGGGLFWRYRRRAARRQAAQDAALRQRLAADLHDDVGSLLTQISLQSDLLRETPAPPEATLARLNRLSDTSRRAARQMADVVWGLHTSSAELPEVLAHMRDHAHEVLTAQGLAVDFAVSEEASVLNPGVAVCQTLYLIFKEALHNVVKHARGATQVTVCVSSTGNQLCLRVRDDAPGPAPTVRPGGHGLANMRRRAEAAGGSLHFVAEANGFGVVVCMPA